MCSISFYSPEFKFIHFLPSDDGNPGAIFNQHFVWPGQTLSEMEHPVILKKKLHKNLVE